MNATKKNGEVMEGKAKLLRSLKANKANKSFKTFPRNATVFRSQNCLELIFHLNIIRGAQSGKRTAIESNKHANQCNDSS